MDRVEFANSARATEERDSCNVINGALATSHGYKATRKTRLD